MKFNHEYFDAGIYRMGTRSEKWDMARQRGREDLIPLWVADMDFPSPPAVQQALLTRAAHGTYGYTGVEPDDFDALINFWQRHHQVELSHEDLLMIPCVVTGLKLGILALTNPGDGVIIQTPVYGPFRFSVEATERKVLSAPLLRREDGGYDMNFPAIEEHLKNGAKLMILCSPHNPVSRLWKQEELEQLLALLRRYNVPLISDEIHADFVYAPGKFVSMLRLASENVICLCAASKTFNLAGLQQATCLCKDEAIREKLHKQEAFTGVRSGNIFALEGTRAAYNEGDEWLEGLMQYLDGNRKYLSELVARLLPKAVLTPMEATYLGWLDLRAYGMNTEELMQRTSDAGVAFTGGTFFGPEGDGFLRVNIATQRRYLETGIRRLAEVLKEA